VGAVVGIGVVPVGGALHPPHDTRNVDDGVLDVKATHSSLCAATVDTTLPVQSELKYTPACHDDELWRLSHAARTLGWNGSESLVNFTHSPLPNDTRCATCPLHPLCENNETHTPGWIGAEVGFAVSSSLDEPSELLL